MSGVHSRWIMSSSYNTYLSANQWSKYVIFIQEWIICGANKYYLPSTYIYIATQDEQQRFKRGDANWKWNDEGDIKRKGDCPFASNSE